MTKDAFPIRRVMILVLTAAMVVSMAGCGAKKEKTNVKTEEIFVVPAEEAIEYVQEFDGLGYENATSELVESSTAIIGGDNYIRLQQQYCGIPVLGRVLVYITDENGNVSDITGNVKDIDPELDLNPTITTEQAAQSFRTYAQENLGFENTDQLSLNPLTEDMLCIYSTNTADALAYKTYVSGYTVVIDAHDASILNCVSSVSMNGVTYTGPKGTENVEGMEKVKGKYILADSERNIYIYEVKNRKSFITKKNSDDPESYPFTELKKVTSTDTKFGDRDDNTNKSAAAYVYLNYLGKVYDFYTNIESTIPVEGAQKKGSHEILIGIYNDTLGDFKGNNACAGVFSREEFTNFHLVGEKPNIEKWAMVDMGSEYSKDEQAILNNIDTIGHEYTHTVFMKYHDQAVYANPKVIRETDAINEGVADVMGELFEASVNSNSKGIKSVGNLINSNKAATPACDWIHGNRNLQDPHNSTRPAHVDEIFVCENKHLMHYGTTSPKCCDPQMNKKGEITSCNNSPDGSQHGGINCCLLDFAHGASLIISHSGYLMWNGIDGDETKKIPEDKLAELFYRTIQRIPDDCSFLRFREEMENAAKDMDDLTEKQRACVGEAFNRGWPPGCLRCRKQCPWRLHSADYRLCHPSKAGLAGNTGFYQDPL